jgi:dephospho-CoA kinase
LRAFARHGAAVLSSDDVVHRLIAEDADVRAALEERFGTTERGRIAEIVFADADALAWLEGLLHPRVRRFYRSWLEQVEADVAAVEVPLLFETGAEELFDLVVVVTAPEDVRRARTRVDLERRSGRLMSDDEKVKRADFAYANDGSLDELDTFVASVLDRVRS